MCPGNPLGNHGQRPIALAFVGIGGDRAVLARYNKGSTMAAKAATPAQLRGRPRTATAKAAVSKRSSPSLADQVLALAIGKTQQEVAAACKGARPNHVGSAISRHKRAGRIEERNGKLYGTQAMEQPAMV